MKTNCKILPFAVMLLLCAPAHAQLGNLLNRAKNAVEQGVSRTTQQASGAAINAIEGNDQGTQTSSNASSALSSAVSSVTGNSIPAGPEVPELMSLAPSWNPYDATGKYISGLAWGLRKKSGEEARELADKLTARAKYDREIIAGMESGKYESDYDTKSKLENEVANWTNFYTQLGQIVTLFFSAPIKKDVNGLWYYEGSHLFLVGLSMTGVEASEEWIVRNKSARFTQRDNKTFFCSSNYEPLVADSDQIAMATRDYNLMQNIAILFEGYPVDYRRETERGVMAEDYEQFYNRALIYAQTAKLAIDGNSPANLEFKPIPAAGGLNASLKAQALAAEKSRKPAVLDVVITSDSWDVQVNALGTPIRRVVYGYSISNDQYGKYATRLSWSQDYQGGSYGPLHSYGIGGGGSFYVK
jgi:hypothetical protein